MSHASDSVLQSFIHMFNCSFNDARAAAATLVIESIALPTENMYVHSAHLSADVPTGVGFVAPPPSSIDDAEDEDVGGGEEGRRVSRPG